jgi:hypothetical protein
MPQVRPADIVTGVEDALIESKPAGRADIGINEVESRRILGGT